MAHLFDVTHHSSTGVLQFFLKFLSEPLNGRIDEVRARRKQSS